MPPDEPLAVERKSGAASQLSTRNAKEKKSKKRSSESNTSKKKLSRNESQKKKKEYARSKIRNGKAKNAGARLGGFLRSSLSFSRHKNRSISLGEAPEPSITAESLPVKVFPSCDMDDRSAKSSRTSRTCPSPRSFESASGDGKCDLDRSCCSRCSKQSVCSTHSSQRCEAMFHRSLRSFASSGKSESSIYSLSEGDVEDFELHNEVARKSKPKRIESKTHTEARERLILESQKAIERKQQNAWKQTSSHSERSLVLSSHSLSPKRETHLRVQSRSLSMDHRSLFNSDHSPSWVAVAHSERPCVPYLSENKALSPSRVKSNLGTKVTNTIVSSNARPLGRIQSMVETRSVEKFQFRGSQWPGDRSRSKSPSRRFAALFLNQKDSCETDDCLEWHDAILRHDWERVKAMLRTYNHTLYKKSRSSGQHPPEKTRSLAETQSSNLQMDNNQNLSPLLNIDSKGRTPLHLACIEHMPHKLLLRLLFVERSAAGVKDADGRFALHAALINNLDRQILDRLIHAFPDSLGSPDCLRHTPIQYGVLKAEYIRDKTVDLKWSIPTRQPQIFSQRGQEDAWKNVSFVLEAMISRRKPLSLAIERTVLVNSVKFLAPPTVVNQLLTVGGRALLEDPAMSTELLVEVFRLQHPIYILKRVLKITSKVLSNSVMLGIVRQNLIDHFKRGCVEGGGTTTTSKAQAPFGKELVHYYRAKECGKNGEISPACQEWWDKLRFLIAHASCRFDDDTDEIILHTALTNPASPPCLIEFLCRLFPAARYEIDVRTGALPLHLACMYWSPLGSGDKNESNYLRVLHLLTAGDVLLIQSRCKNRLPLHHAIATGKPPPFINALLVLDKNGVAVPDPKTLLFPFQLASVPPKRSLIATKDEQTTIKNMPDKTDTRDDAITVGLVFELLRSNPFVMTILIGCQSEDMTPLTRHILRWCYDWSISGWRLNVERKDVLRMAIRRGKIPGSLKVWWSTLKTLIWRSSNDLVDNRGQNPMCETPQTRDYLLHAALWNGSKIPPIVIELILELYPASVLLRQPGTGLYPLQITAQSLSYRPFSFEETISMSSALEMLSLIHEDAFYFKTKTGRLPIHQALWSGKTWPEVRTLAEIAPETLLIADPSSGLLPFQAAACSSSFVPKNLIFRSSCLDTQWAEYSPEENARSLTAIYHAYDLEKLTTIFEILRTTPAAIIGR